MPNSSPPLGNLVRIAPLEWTALPAHSAFPDHKSHKPGNSGNGSDNRPPLIPFIKELLGQAVSFVDDIVPKTFTAGKEKNSSPAKAKVQLLKRDVQGNELHSIQWSGSSISRSTPPSTNEAWFARRSRHSNKQEDGSADFSEFATALRDDHSEHEREYTPDVYDSYRVLDWDVETAAEGFKIDGYSMIRMQIYEMAHALPFPLSPRVFPVLALTANTGHDQFIVVQIPVDITTLPAAMYSNGRNLREGEGSQKRKKPVLGVYTSVERVKLEGSDVEWVMATASNAKGWLPMAVQKTGVPGAVVKDVGFLMKWIAARRGR
jgi:hypothetical protein